jgi:hypothetical protein
MLVQEQQLRRRLEQQLSVFRDKLCEETARGEQWEGEARVLQQLADEEAPDQS